MSREDIRRAMKVLAQTPDNILYDVRTELLDAFTEIRKRIRLRTDPCTEILDTLSACIDDINGKQSEVADIISKIKPEQADIRFQHAFAEQPGTKSFIPRVQAIFAYRSLGFEFDGYLESHYGVSRVTELSADLTKAERKSSGRINEFLRRKGQDDEPSRKAVRFAIKLLVLERIFGISWLVTFIISKIRNVPFSSLTVLSHLLSEHGGVYSKLGTLATSFSCLIQEGQKQYDGRFPDTFDVMLLIYGIALVSPYVISKNPHLDRLGTSTEHRQTSYRRTEAAPAVDPRSDIPSTSSQCSDTTPANSNSDSHGAPSLHDQSFESELASECGQTSEQARIACTSDNGEQAELHLSKRRRILSQNVRGIVVRALSEIITG
jgi:hypothetical protein